MRFVQEGNPISENIIPEEKQPKMANKCFFVPRKRTRTEFVPMYLRCDSQRQIATFFMLRTFLKTSRYPNMLLFKEWTRIF